MGKLTTTITTTLFGALVATATGLLTLSALTATMPPQPLQQAAPATTYTPTLTAQYSQMFTNSIYDTTPPPPVNLTPTVTLGGKGGDKELDYCNGKFIEMIDYQKVRDVNKIYSAHNSCGGATIIPLNHGDEIIVSGTKYTVVSIKNSPKVGTGVTDLIGMEGDIILQTCYYRSSMMKFVGLEKVTHPAA